MTQDLDERAAGERRFRGYPVADRMHVVAGEESLGVVRETVQQQRELSFVQVTDAKLIDSVGGRSAGCNGRRSERAQHWRRAKWKGCRGS